MNMSGILATFIAGAFFLIGALINKGFSKKDKILDFSMGLALVIALGLVIFDLLPHAIEHFEHLSTGYIILFIVIFAGLGIIVLKIIDLLIPQHTHDHKDNEKNHDEHNEHISHIGVVTSIALVFHNIIEGIVIYNSVHLGSGTGLLLALGIALHNIPMGMQISATLNEGKAGKNKKIGVYLALVLSTPLGALIMLLLSGIITEFATGIMIAFAMGTLIYIALFELLKEVLHNKDKSASIIGMAIGLILVIISIMTGGHGH